MRHSTGFAVGNPGVSEIPFWNFAGNTHAQSPKLLPGIMLLNGQRSCQSSTTPAAVNVVRSSLACQCILTLRCTTVERRTSHTFAETLSRHCFESSTDCTTCLVSTPISANALSSVKCTRLTRDSCRHAEQDALFFRGEMTVILAAHFSAVQFTIQVYGALSCSSKIRDK